MSALLLENDSFISNPLDHAEAIIMNRDWAFERPIDDELVAEVSGLWCNYRLWFTWQPDLGALVFSCAFETKLPKQNRAKVYPLLAMVNEKLWLGHFDLCSDDGSITFRHALILRGSNGAAPEQMEDLIDIAINECERFYPAFQSVIWGGKNSEEAFEIAIFDTVGEA